MLAIRFYRLKRGWSQSTLGDRVGQNQTAISFIETGRRIPDEDLLNRLAVALDVFPAYILLRKIEIPTQPPVFKDTGERVAS